MASKLRRSPAKVDFPPYPRRGQVSTKDHVEETRKRASKAVELMQADPKLGIYQACLMVGITRNQHRHWLSETADDEISEPWRQIVGPYVYAKAKETLDQADSEIRTLVFNDKAREAGVLVTWWKWRIENFHGCLLDSKPNDAPRIAVNIGENSKVELTTLSLDALQALAEGT